MSWIHLNNNENVSHTSDQNHPAKIKRIEEKEYKDEIDKLEAKAENKTDDEKGINVQRGQTTPEKTKADTNDTTYGLNESDLTPDAFPVNNSQTYIGLISAALTVIVFFASCTIFLMKQRGRNKVALLQKHTALLCGSPTSGINTKDIKLPTPVVVNNLSQSRLSLKSKIAAANNDYKYNDMDASEQRSNSACEKINKILSEQHVKCEAGSSYKTEYFGMYKIVLLIAMISVISAIFINVYLLCLCVFIMRNNTIFGEK